MMTGRLSNKRKAETRGSSQFILDSFDNGDN